MKARSSEKIEIYLEIGKKKTFAGALDWPGWCRSGKDEPSALQALLEYGERYKLVLKPAKFGFQAPIDGSAFTVMERLEGNSTTDFGAPGVIPASDAKPIDETELIRLQSLLAACLPAFDKAVNNARGKELSKGPRGGGRELDGIIEHVLGANKGYLSNIGVKLKENKAESSLDAMRWIHNVMLESLTQSARGELPTHGPRGGVYWPPRYFIRRVAWHMLDHAWEIEDRIV